jgi:hypothetical protein
MKKTNSINSIYQVPSTCLIVFTLMCTFFPTHLLHAVWPFSKNQPPAVGANLNQTRKNAEAALKQLNCARDNFWKAINMNISRSSNKFTKEQEVALHTLQNAINEFEAVERNLRLEEETALQEAAEQCVQKLEALKAARDTWYQYNLTLGNVTKAQYQKTVEQLATEFQKARNAVHEAESHSASVLEKMKQRTYEAYEASKELAKQGFSQLKKFATKAGEKTAATGHSAWEHIEDAGHSVADTVKDLAEHAEKKAEHLKDRLTHLVTQQEKTAQQSLEHAKEHLKKHEEHEGILSTVKGIAVDTKNYALDKVHRVKDFFTQWMSHHQMSVTQAKAEANHLLEEAHLHGDQLKKEASLEAKNLEESAKIAGAQLVKQAQEHEENNRHL